jgi:hypothetical protein
MGLNSAVSIATSSAKKMKNSSLKHRGIRQFEPHLPPKIKKQITDTGFTLVVNIDRSKN